MTITVTDTTLESAAANLVSIQFGLPERFYSHLLECNNYKPNKEVHKNESHDSHV